MCDLILRTCSQPLAAHRSDWKSPVQESCKIVKDQLLHLREYFMPMNMKLWKNARRPLQRSRAHNQTQRQEETIQREEARIGDMEETQKHSLSTQG